MGTRRGIALTTCNSIARESGCSTGLAGIFPRGNLLRQSQATNLLQHRDLRWFAVRLLIQPTSGQTQRPAKYQSDKVEKALKKLHVTPAAAGHKSKSKHLSYLKNAQQAERLRRAPRNIS
jgi:hypothetical protein